MKYIAIFHGCKNCQFQKKNTIFFFYLLKNIDRGSCWKRLIEAILNKTILTSTHIIFFGAEIRTRKILHTPLPQFYYIFFIMGSKLHRRVSMVPCQLNVKQVGGAEECDVYR